MLASTGDASRSRIRPSGSSTFAFWLKAHAATRWVLGRPKALPAASAPGGWPLRRVYLWNQMANASRAYQKVDQDASLRPKWGHSPRSWGNGGNIPLFPGLGECAGMADGDRPACSQLHARRTAQREAQRAAVGGQLSRAGRAAQRAAVSGGGGGSCGWAGPGASASLYLATSRKLARSHYTINQAEHLHSLI